ncbi:MAG: PAS domain S-box protein [Anaerolineaceae bacterium]|nr:PAS domain S-box protein [Anaerolineaceae bacterium]
MRTTGRHQIWLFLALSVGVYLVWLLLAPPEMEARLWAARLPVIVSGLAAFGMAWHAWRRSHEAKLRQAWTGLLIAIGLWTGADLYALFVQRMYPGQARGFDAPELLSLAACVAVLAVIWVTPRGFSRRLGRMRLSLDVFITLAAVAALTWLLIFQPLGSTPAVLLPAADALLLLALLDWFLTNEPGPRTALPGWLAFVLSAYLVSDLASARQFLFNASDPSRLANIGWFLGDLILILAAWMHSSPHKTLVLFRDVQGTARRVQSLLPFIALTILGWYILLQWQIQGRIPLLGLWVAVILAFAFVARLSLMAGEVEFEQYARLVNNISEPTFVCSQQGELELVNPALLEITGCESESSLLGASLQQFIRPSGRAESILKEALAGGWDGEVSLLRRDGSWTPVYLSLRVLSRPGERLSLAGTAHNLAEIKRGQAALQQAYEKLAATYLQLELLNEDLEKRVDEKTASLSEAYAQLEVQNQALQNLDRLKSDFVSLVSHDLRAPLTNINGGLELVLSRSSKLPTGERQTLTLVQAEISRLTRFIETILDISALDAGRMPLHPLPTDLQPIFEGLQRHMTHLASAERISWNLPPNLPRFIADSQALFSVLFHLLDNAVKYAPEGPIQVNAGTATDRGWISVSDEGEGIPERDMPLLFTRFFRSHSSDAQTVYGHGLGLYIVQRLLEAMDGKIEVTNRPVQGACFTCWLPIESNVHTEAT